MTRRAEFSRTTRLNEWDASGGCCRDCGRKLYPGDGFHYDHIVPAEQGGGNGQENCQLLCTGCHSRKTGEDMAVIAKTRAVRAKHVGAHKPRRPIPGSRASGWKQRLTSDGPKPERRG